MRLEGLEETLARITEIGTPVKVRPYRQIWRFEHLGTPLFLKWYPRRGQRLKRLFRGRNPAQFEFEQLQMLQRATLPAPRAVVYLGGMQIGRDKGDGVITRAIEPSESLDAYLHGFQLQGLRAPDHREIVEQVITLLQALASAGLGHGDLHLGNVLRRPPGPGGKLHLLDAYAVKRDGLSLKDLEVLWHAVSGVATRTDLLRGWRRLGSGDRPPAGPPAIARRQWRKSVERMCDETAYAGEIELGPWEGLYFKRAKFPGRMFTASGLTPTADEWQRIAPGLIAGLDAGTFYPLKQSQSGDVWATQVVLSGIPLDVVVKRPYRRYWYRYMTEAPRGSRAWRAWWKAWALLARGIPTAWPLLMLEKRRMGVVVDQLIVCERVMGKQLDHHDHLALPRETVETMFRRTGRLLRRIDDTGLVHFDTKASNFIVRMDEATGPQPVLVDVDGVRTYPWRGEGLRRLKDSLSKQLYGYQPWHGEALAAGYAPFEKRAKSSGPANERGPA